MHMRMQDSEVNHAYKHHSEWTFFAKLLAYVRDMHGGLYIIRQDVFLTFSLLIFASYSYIVTDEPVEFEK